MLLTKIRKLISFGETNRLIMFMITNALLLAEILATIWVFMYFTFEPIIPVYQGY